MAARGRCDLGVDEEDEVWEECHQSESHGLFRKMGDSGQDSDRYHRNTEYNTQLPRPPSEVPLQFETDNSRRQEDEGDETEPDDESVGREVLVVVVEVRQDAGFHAVAPAQVSDDQRCGVVEEESHHEIDPDCGEPARGETH